MNTTYTMHGTIVVGHNNMVVGRSDMVLDFRHMVLDIHLMVFHVMPCEIDHTDQSDTIRWQSCM